ncbi:MAG: hypothetical protein A2Z17_04420 [Gammaproteobacteria bacterium RBG_16_66_13]|nr:MAG: hypothetical protein A2Z17_04420 [Gammaproteobacteria bacterium RBG_16_66_13]
MRWRLILIAGVTAAALSASAVAVWAQFLASHDASGQANTAASTTDVLYICQPSGTTTTPQCPIDTMGADETIYVSSEDMVPGSVRWQKLRVTNVGGEPWDILNMASSWTEVSDPSGLCSTVPEAVIWQFGVTTAVGGQGPGVTILGKIGAGAYPDPVEGVSYQNSINDNHSSVAGTAVFSNRGLSGYGLPNSNTVHVAPGDYEDLVLGLRLPTSTPSACLDVVWQLTTTWNIQVHVP